MNTAAQAAPTALSSRHWLTKLDAWIGKIPMSLTQLILRITVALPFWRSGLTKWDGVRISESAVYLFREEFKLHVFGRTYSYPWPELMATLSGLGEIILPILLVIGLGTRLAAVGIVLMTLIIQLTIPDAWANVHLPWIAMALAIATFGPGKLSIDYWWRRPH